MLGWGAMAKPHLEEVVCWCQRLLGPAGTSCCQHPPGISESALSSLFLLLQACSAGPCHGG